MFLKKPAFWITAIVASVVTRAGYPIVSFWRFSDSAARMFEALRAGKRMTMRSKPQVLAINVFLNVWLIDAAYH